MKVGVLLAGCGVLDGSEIYESVLTILAIERAGAEVAAIAPDVPQDEIINHYSGGELRTGAAGGPTRNVLSESARIVRGKVTSLKEVSAHDFDAIIIPGGYGVTKNLCTYAVDEGEASVNDEVRRLINEMATLRKPIGALCIAPVLIALCLGDKKPSLTVGTDAKVTVDLQRMGAEVIATEVTDIHVDSRLNIVSSAAFLLAESVSEAEAGVTKLVNKVIDLAKAL